MTMVVVVVECSCKSEGLVSSSSQSHFSAFYVARILKECILFALSHFWTRWFDWWYHITFIKINIKHQLLLTTLGINHKIINWYLQLPTQCKFSFMDGLMWVFIFKVTILQVSNSRNIIYFARNLKSRIF